MNPIHTAVASACGGSGGSGKKERSLAFCTVFARRIINAAEDDAFFNRARPNVSHFYKDFNCYLLQCGARAHGARVSRVAFVREICQH